MNRPAQIAHARTAVLSEQASCPSAGNKYIGFIKLTQYLSIFKTLSDREDPVCEARGFYEHIIDKSILPRLSLKHDQPWNHPLYSVPKLGLHIAQNSKWRVKIILQCKQSTEAQTLYAECFWPLIRPRFLYLFKLVLFRFHWYATNARCWFNILYRARLT